MRRGILLVVFSVFCSFPPLLYLGASQENAAIEMKVKRIFVDRSTKNPTPVVILENAREKKFIPIWIGKQEATSIAMVLEKVAIPRPNTHDLIRNILRGVGAVLNRITITDLRENIYYASLTLKLDAREFQIDSRPSDAIAVALRMKAPIYASSRVLAKAGRLPSPQIPREHFRKIMGIHVQDLTSELASLFNLRVQEGVLVADVEPGSIASKAGFQRGDVITRINYETSNNVAELESLLKGMKKLTRIVVELKREGRPVTILLDPSP